MRLRIIALIIVTSILPLFGSAYTYSSSEYIKLFESDVTIKADRSLRVVENITYVNNRKNSTHGIVREFPTKYGSLFVNHSVGFDVEQVLRDGRHEPFVVRAGDNGQRVFIGSPHINLIPGTYRYQITYVTTRQLGFFENHDELFWNVTGNGWRLPILQAVARIHLPKPVPQSDLQIKAYTGPYESSDDNYVSNVIEPGVVEFKTTKLLFPLEGLTIAVGFPKGIVTPESFISKAARVLMDNLGMLISLLLVGLSALASLLYIIFNRTSQRPGTIIPLYEPPADMTPGRMRYLYKKSYDAQVLSSDIVYLAVNGYLTINYNKSAGIIDKFFSSSKAGTYELVKKNPQPTSESPLARDLFQTNSTVIISEDSRPTLVRTIQAYKERIEAFSSTYFFKNNWLPNLIRFSFILMFFVPFILFLLGASFVGNILFMFIIIPAFILFESLIAYRMKLYKPEGRRVMDKIEGFKMYLMAVEVPRMKYIGTPPTKTPELYEKYLPYAMALSVEDKWSKQFTPIFARLEQEGRPYQPMWYMGPRPFGYRDINGFSSDLRNSFTGAISASYEPPGSRTGFGSGGGGSGRGGGGGGGGSW